MKIPVKLYIDGTLKFTSTYPTVEVDNLKKGEIMDSKEVALLGSEFTRNNYVIEDFVVGRPTKDSIELVTLHLKSI